MQKYGLERGIRGSETRHIDTTQFYKMVYTENKLLKEENKELAQEQQDIRNSVRSSLYDMKDKAQDDLNLLFSVFPQLSERSRIAQLCKVAGLKIEDRRH